MRLDHVDQSIRRASSSGWDGTVRLMFGIGAPPGASLAAVALAFDSSEPCAGGTPAHDVSIDDREALLAEPAPVGGSHRIEVSLRHARDDVTDYHYVDFSFRTAAGKHCERVSVTGPPDPEWHLARHGVFGMVMGVDVPLHAVSNTSALLPFQLALGDRRGRLQIAVEPGIFAVGICASCEADERGRRPAVLAVPFGGGAMWYPFSGAAIGLELRLREYALWTPTDSGRRFSMLHAPATVVHLGLAPSRPRPGLSPGPRLIDVDLEIPIGIVAAHEDTGNRVEPYFGAGASVWWWR